MALLLLEINYVKYIVFTKFYDIILSTRMMIVMMMKNKKNNKKKKKKKEKKKKEKKKKEKKKKKKKKEKKKMMMMMMIVGIMVRKMQLWLCCEVCIMMNLMKFMNKLMIMIIIMSKELQYGWIGAGVRCFPQASFIGSLVNTDLPKHLF